MGSISPPPPQHAAPCLPTLARVLQPRLDDAAGAHLQRAHHRRGQARVSAGQKVRAGGRAGGRTRLRCVRRRAAWLSASTAAPAPRLPLRLSGCPSPAGPPPSRTACHALSCPVPSGSTSPQHSRQHCQPPTHSPVSACPPAPQRLQGGARPAGQRAGDGAPLCVAAIHEADKEHRHSRCVRVCGSGCLFKCYECVCVVQIARASARPWPDLWQLLPCCACWATAASGARCRAPPTCLCFCPKSPPPSSAPRRPEHASVR